MRTALMALALISACLIVGCGEDATGPTTQRVTGVSISKSSITIIKGETEQLTATVEPSSAAITSVVWASRDNAVASVSDSGLVVGVSVGLTAIVVTTEDGEFSDSCEVAIVAVPVSGVTLSPSNAEVEVGDTVQLIAEVEPSDAGNQSIVWNTSNDLIATVTELGLVTGVSLGSAILTVTTADGGFSDSCEVTVLPVAVTGVSVIPSTVTVEVGASAQLMAEVHPSDAVNQNVTWSSSNSTIATVTESGLVTGVSLGSAIVTVTTEDGGFSDPCDVLVDVTRVTGVAIAPRSAVLLPGESLQLTAEVSPANATDQRVVWHSEDESIAAVSSTGVVVADGVGTAHVFVTTLDGGFADSSQIAVEPIGVTGVTVSRSSVELVAGLTEQLSATILPENATNQLTSWTSQNPQVATVSPQGLVRGIAVGATEVAVTTDDGGFTDFCAVTVTPAQLISLAVAPMNATIEVNDSLQFTADGTYTDDSVLDVTQEVVWTSSDDTIVTIGNDEETAGLARGVSVGSVQISAELDGLLRATPMSVVRPYFSEIGVPCVAVDGLTVTLHYLTVTQQQASYRYSIYYTLRNDTADQVIDEGSFKMYYAAGFGGLPQYGSFGRLFPGQSVNRSYVFEELSSSPFGVLEYHHDNFFSSFPLPNSLKWRVVIPGL